LKRLGYARDERWMMSFMVGFVFGGVCVFVIWALEIAYDKAD
jgi:hypothetical protein